MTLLSVLVDAWLDDLRLRNCSQKTIQGYRKRLGPYLKWAALHHFDTVEDFTTDSVRHYLAERQEDGLHEPGTLRNDARDLKAFASWIALRKHTKEHVLSELTVPQTFEEPPHPFTDDELKRLFASFDLTNPTHLRDRLIFGLLLDTGLRIEELVRLRRDNISFEDRSLMILHTKNRKYRRISYGIECEKLLTRYLKTHPVGPKEPVFYAQNGKPITEHLVGQRCLFYQKTTGIHVHPHRFRHTFAVTLLKKGVNLRVIQELLGHSDIRVTARYLTLTNDDILRVQQQASPFDDLAISSVPKQRKRDVQRPQLRLLSS